MAEEEVKKIFDRTKENPPLSIYLDPKDQWLRDRLTEYPEVSEQMDMLFKDMTSGKFDKTGDWYKAIAKVKSDNPKG
tara:strand:- start:60 stop:290 length:231 start_codon:yes stop_codon:yes gene_type:complete